MEERLAEARETGKLNLGYLEDGSDALDGAIEAALAAGIRVAELDISSCGLTALPAALPHLGRTLRALRLKYNPGITSLDVDTLCQLPRLELVDADGCGIAALDAAALPRLSTLRHLSLASNGLASLPDSISSLPGLAVLCASNNPLAALPEDLGACPALEVLDVSGCRLAGDSLPPSLALCRTLQRLFCQNNELTKVPPAMGHLKGLKEWNLRANRLPLKYEQARERGLAKFLAFLREEEEIEQLAEIERNRPVGIASGPATVYRCKAVLEDALAAAAAGEPTSGYAWVRQGHAACLLGRSVYLWGGMVVREGRNAGQLLVMNLDSCSWRVQPTRGDAPGPRDGHVMVADPHGRQLIVFGGRKENGRRTADLHLLSLDTWTWYAPKLDSEVAPPPREQCAAAFADGRLLLFGGRTNGSRLNDLWQFDTATWRWEQLPAHGTAPSPRQGAAACLDGGRLWLVGGASNFVLDDVFTYSLEQQEWRAVSVESSGGKPVARAGGHVIAPDGTGGLFLFGGSDALGMQHASLLRLKQQCATFEWTETDVVFEPDRSRIVLFDPAAEGRLVAMQCGHPLHKLHVSADQVACGEAVLDAVQIVPLNYVQEQAPRAEGLLACANPKQERIRHATLAASKLPPAFSSHTAREKQVLAAAAAFKERWVAGAAAATAAGVPTRRLLPAVTLLNECGTEKVVCTTLRPASLPHVELYDLEGIAQFVSEFFTYEPLEDPCRPPTRLVSPWSLLEWQAGDSFDLATLACSLALGAGYDAAVVVGYAPKEVALGSQARAQRPWLKEHGIEEPPYVDLPEQQPSFEPEPVSQPDQTAAAEAASTDAQMVGGTACAAAAEAGGAEAGTATPPAAPSRPATGDNAPLAAPSRPATGATAQSTASSRPATGATAPPAQGETVDPPATAATGSEPAGGCEPAAAAAPADHVMPTDAVLPAEPAAEACGPPGLPLRLKQYVHAFVLVKAGKRELPRTLLLDPATGQLYAPDAAPCTGVEWAFTATNFYLNLQCSSSSSSSQEGGSSGAAGCSKPPHGLTEVGLMDWAFSNPNCWQPLLVGKEERSQDAGTVASGLYTAGSKVSDLRSVLLGHGASQLLGGARSSPMLDRLGSGLYSFKASGTPRGLQPLLGSPSAAGAVPTATPAAAEPGGRASPSGPAAAASAAAALKGGVALSHLAMGGRHSTPGLGGGRAPHEQVSSLAFLSADASAQPPPGQRSSTALLVGSPSASPLGAAMAAPVPGTSPLATLAPVSGSSGCHPQLPPSPEMPLSWVPPLALSRERLDMRCPRGLKVQVYRQARRELFAHYGECGRWDGMVERLTTYADPERTCPLCVLELFSRRKDRLVRRQTWLGPGQQRTVLSSFEPGAAACLASMRIVRGGPAPPGSQPCSWEVELRFCSDSRPDGLLRRVHSESSLEEWYLPGSRPDGLAHRIVQYAAASSGTLGSADSRPHSALGPARPSAHRHRSSGATGSWAEASERAIACIREQFTQKGAAAVPLLERTFDLAGGRLMLSMPDGHGAMLSRTYALDGALLEGPPASTPEQQRQEHAALRTASGAAQVAVQAAEDELRGTLQARQRAEQSCQLATPHYDAPRLKVEDSDEGSGQPEEEAGYDPLSHFLPHTGARDMTAAEAEEARAACLAAFDDRWAARRVLLAQRLSESSAEVARLAGVLATEQQHLSTADLERVQQEHEAAAFRLKVAQRRAGEHGPLAQQKRAELERQLDGDKRLRAALAAGA